jgi:hypothetical protein
MPMRGRSMTTSKPKPDSNVAVALDAQLHETFEHYRLTDAAVRVIETEHPNLAVGEAKRAINDWSSADLLLYLTVHQPAPAEDPTTHWRFAQRLSRKGSVETR